MHPNWKALSTVDFPRKIFVRQTENPEKSPSETRSAGNGKCRGDETRKFYEEVLSTESEPVLKQEATSPISRSERRKRNRLVKVKEEFREKKEVDRNDFRNALIAAQNDDLESMRNLLSSHSNSGSLLSARDPYDWTLLMVAVCANAGRVTGLLLEQDQVDLGAKDRAGNTALELAKKRGLKKMVQLIRNKEHQQHQPMRFEPKPKSRKREPEAASTSTQDDANKYSCDVCHQSFKDLEDWKKHVTSMLHLLNRNKQEVEAGELRTHFVIPEANRGYQMMLSGGWDKKSGLGPSGLGKLYPVKTILKRDRHGLGLERESGSKVTPKVTHFEANDVVSVRDASEDLRTERSATQSRRKQIKKLTKDKVKEVKFRREFSSL